MRKKLSGEAVKSNFMIKLRSWEYWPFGIIQFPFMLYWLWLSIRSRSFFFFSASNPQIPMGGMLGESKYDILKSIPQAFTPRTILVNLPTTKEQVMQKMKFHGFMFPVIFKPDLGERGRMVRKIRSEEEIEVYLQEISISFIIQEFVDLPLEFGVFYRRYPSEENGEVTSIVMKQMLFVEGDGRATLRELILTKDRAKLQWDKLQQVYADQLNRILSPGEKLELVSIGNHALGTTFLDGNHLINAQLSESFDRISKQIDGFFFGRFDLRTASYEDLQNGNVKIMELNGCGAEPAHIYQPGYPLLKALGVMYRHWRDLFRISQENHRDGIKFVSFKEGMQYYRKFKEATSR